MNISDAAFQLETQIVLPENEVHLWRIDLASVASSEERWKEFLTEEERSRAARFHFSRDRQHFTATRALLRIVLAGYANSNPAKLQLEYASNGKPSFRRSATQDSVEFNVSHSGEIAMLAFTRGRALGVDVEYLRDNFDHEAIARRFFSEHEQHQLATLPQAERYQAFFRCWTRKEAYIKAEGVGLSLPLHQFDVSLRPGETNALLATRPDGSEATKWSLQEIPAAEGYVAALCVRGHGWHLKS
jgi:4'-phosphopantetheinyl transferase